jgi:hypothetical protein
MSRIFLSLAATNLSLIVASYVLGLISVSSGPGRHDRELGVHFLIGLFTVMFSLLVHSIVYTYLMGTNRWVREVAEVYKMPPEFAARSKAHKRKGFKWEFRAMTMVAVAAWLGAWVHREYPRAVPTQSLYHHIAAVGVIVVSLVAFSLEYKLIGEQGKLLDEVKDLADDMREKRIAERVATESNGPPAEPSSPSVA